MGKGGRDANDSEKSKQEVLIDGRYYDVTAFRHPGGSVITFYAGKGIDATDAFSNFHMNSKKAKKILEKLPSRAAEQNSLDKLYLPGQKTLLEDFHEFQQQLEKEGLFKPSVAHTVYRFTEVIIMHAIGFYFLFHNHIIPAVLILGVVCGRCGWLMHEGTIGIDRILQAILYGVGCGMSGSWWRNQHNKHHSMPQKLNTDVDLNTLPLVCFNSSVVKRIGLPVKVWIRLQSLMFPLITTLLVALTWQFYLHPRHILRAKQWIEGVSIIARYVLISLFIVPKFGAMNTFLLYLAYTWCGANYIFINFAVSHTHLPVVAKDDTTTDWLRYASVHTMNVHPGPFNFVNWWMGYLNFQIEHHLFPCMPQFRHPMISPRVKEFFEKHGLKYDQRSYAEAMAVTFQNLHSVGNEVFLG